MPPEHMTDTELAETYKQVRFDSGSYARKVYKEFHKRLPFLRSSSLWLIIE